MPVSVGDVWRPYSKRTTGKTDGALIFRKKSVNRQSARVRAVNDKVRANPPASRAKERCLRDAPPSCIYIARVYIPGEGYTEEKRCRIKCLVKYLAEEMKSTVGPGKVTPGVAMRTLGM